MKKHDSSIDCPTCHGPLNPRVLACSACDIKVEGHFQQNEFASLNESDLHFLRIFIFCEGRIRDMERSLGVSYPTIKAKVAALKDSLRMTSNEEPRDQEEPPSTMDLLAALEKGRLTFKEAMNHIADNAKQ
jgi:hypothetical protein